MKKIFLLLLLLTLLSACGKKEVVVQPIPDIVQSYNYVDTAVPVIDAIIDTDAEIQYLQQIQKQYEQYASYYYGHVSKSSALTPRSNPQQLASIKTGLDDLMKELDYFRNRMNSIDLPSDYRASLVVSLSAFIESLGSEKNRLSQSTSSETKPSSELYQKAQEAQKKVQQIFQGILTS